VDGKLPSRRKDALHVAGLGAEAALCERPFAGCSMTSRCSRLSSYNPSPSYAAKQDFTHSYSSTFPSLGGVLGKNTFTGRAFAHFAGTEHIVLGQCLFTVLRHSTLS
jgi:hypothetical protein